MSGTSRRSTSKPVLAFTCGDPAGIGPDVAAAAMRSPRVRRACEPVAVGEASVWRRAGWRGPVVDTALGLSAPKLGAPSKLSGTIAFAAFRRAVELAGRGLVGGLVTAPISKHAWSLAGVPFTDHTEYLRTATGRSAEMILCAPDDGLWTVTATRHVPLSAVPKKITREAVASSARALRAALTLAGKNRPRLGLCGLNPHAGEEGLLGEEERRVLAPAARALGLEGPIAADAAWRLHRKGALDGLVCLYHDQALIGLKAAVGLRIVNWTVGLPFARTSPGHGTGFDIAQKRAADPFATESAALLAARLA